MDPNERAEGVREKGAGGVEEFNEFPLVFRNIGLPGGLAAPAVVRLHSTTVPFNSHKSFRLAIILQI